MADDIVDPQGAGDLRRLGSELKGVAAQARETLARAEAAAADASAASRRIGETGSEAGRRPSASEPARLSSSDARLKVERGITEELRQQRRLSLPSAPSGYRRGPGGLLVPEAPQGYSRTGGAFTPTSQAPRYQSPAGLVPDRRYLQLLQQAQSVRQSAYQGQPLAQGGRDIYDTLGSKGDQLRRAQEAEQAAGATQKLSDAERASLLTSQQARAQVRGIEQEYGRQTRALGLNREAWRRHGALSTEVISAMARGRTDIRELGFQVSSTIGKFAGWTLAATAVYGVARAIGAMGTGALDSLEGVNNLTRIITNLDQGAAQTKIRDLSQKYNLPIKDVADTAYGMSKVFQDQNATFKATESALFAVKVGELDAATATKYLTAIVNGFHLSAEELPGLFDTINEAQNRFGGNIGSLIQGVAGAAGSFKNVGGSYRDLIALLQTGTRVTGRTGQELGTGLRRSAEYILRPERRQTIIDLLGIDPQDASIVEVYERAMDVVKDATPQRAAEIAKALSTPELSTGRILPILQARSLYGQIKQEIRPSEVKDSAKHELERALRGPREQIAKFGVELQALGSALAQSGFLDPFIALVKLTTTSLHYATELVEVFAGLPGPLKTSAAFMTQIAAAAAIARRFDVGGLAGEGREGRYARATRQVISRDPNRKLRSNVLQGLTEEATFTGEERQRVARELASTRRRDLDLSERLAREVAAGGLTEEEQLERQKSITANRAKVVELTREEDFLHKRQIVVARQESEFSRRTRRGREFAGPVANDLGIYPGDRDIARDRAADPNTTPLLLPGGQQYQRAADLTERQLAQQELHTAATASSVNRLDRALNRGATGLTRFGRTLASMGAGFAAFFGPVEIAVLAAIATGIGINELVNKIEEENKKLKELSSLDPQKAINAANKELGDDSNLDAVFSAVAGGYTKAKSLTAFGGALPTIGSRDERANEKALRDRARAQQVQQQAQPRGALLYQSQVRERLQRRLARASNEEEGQKAIDRAWEEYHASIARLTPANEGNKETRANRKAELARTRDTIRASQAAVAGALSDSASAVEAITSTDQATEANLALQNQVSLRGLGQPQLRRGSRLLTQYRVMASRLAKAGDNKGAQEWLQAAEQLQQGLEQSAKAELDQAIATLPESQHGAARQTYIKRMRTLLQSGTQQRLRRISSKIQLLKIEFDQLEALANLDYRPVLTIDQLATPGAGAGAAAGKASGAGSAARRRRQAIKTQLRGERESRKALKAYLDQSGDAIAQAVAETKDAGTAEETERFDARTQLLQSQTADSVQDAQIMVTRTRQRVALLRQQGATQAEVDRALAEQNEAVQQLASAQLQRFQSLQAMNTAKFAVGASQGALLQRQLGDAQRYAARVKAQGSNVDPGTYYDAMRSVYDAQKALADFVRSQAQELVRAQSAYSQSLTEDPVKLAKIRLDEASKLLKFARTPAERLSAQAEINTRARDLRQTIQREKYEDITFDAELEKIDRQTEISRLQQLLKTIKGNRDLKREIRRRIHQLKKEAEQEVEQLNVGDVRLPSVYEIRRAVGGISRGMAVTQNYYTSVDVKRPQDAGAVGRVLEDYHAGAGQAIERAMGRR